MSNLGSFCLPSVWNGPETLTLTGPWVLLVPPLASTFSARLSLPDLTSLLPLKVSFRSVLTSVSDDASSPPPPQAPTASASAATRREQDGLQ